MENIRKRIAELLLLSVVSIRALQKRLPTLDKLPSEGIPFFTTSNPVI